MPKREVGMPVISMFYGIVIRMFFDEHAPPHFHAQYGEFKASISIESLELLGGNLPKRALELVLDWAELHRDQLLEDWGLCQQHQLPKKIDPLQ
jgi:hypothetical protein